MRFRMVRGSSARLVGRLNAIVSPWRGHFKHRFSQSDAADLPRNPITFG
jgi:hypothetical protein